MKGLLTVNERITLLIPKKQHNFCQMNPLLLTSGCPICFVFFLNNISNFGSSGWNICDALTESESQREQTYKKIKVCAVSLVFGQRDADCRLLPLHLLLRLRHLLLAAGVLQKHGSQVAQTRALGEGEAQHALQDGGIGDLRAWGGC